MIKHLIAVLNLFVTSDIVELFAGLTKEAKTLYSYIVNWRRSGIYEVL